jgi:hypothetical protein
MQKKAMGLHVCFFGKLAGLLGSVKRSGAAVPETNCPFLKQNCAGQRRSLHLAKI